MWQFSQVVGKRPGGVVRVRRRGVGRPGGTRRRRSRSRRSCRRCDSGRRPGPSARRRAGSSPGARSVALLPRRETSRCGSPRSAGRSRTGRGWGSWSRGRSGGGSCRTPRACSCTRRAAGCGGRPCSRVGRGTRRAGSASGLCTWNISRWFVHVVGVWQASQLAPISPRCASLWQSAQAVPTWLNTQRPVAAAAGDLRVGGLAARSPSCSWRKVGGLSTGTHLSGLWHSPQSSFRSPWGCSLRALAVQDQHGHEHQGGGGRRRGSGVSWAFSVARAAGSGRGSRGTSWGAACSGRSVTPSRVSGRWHAAQASRAWAPSRRYAASREWSNFEAFRLSVVWQRSQETAPCRANWPWCGSRWQLSQAWRHAGEAQLGRPARGVRAAVARRAGDAGVASDERVASSGAWSNATSRHESTRWQLSQPPFATKRATSPRCGSLWQSAQRVDAKWSGTDAGSCRQATGLWHWSQATARCAPASG